MDTTKKVITTLEDLNGYRQQNGLYIPVDENITFDVKDEDERNEIAKALLEAHQQLRGAADEESLNLLERIEELLKKLLDDIVQFFKSKSQAFASDSDIAYFSVKEGNLEAFKEVLPSVVDERFELLAMAAARQDDIGNKMVGEIINATQPTELICHAAATENKAVLQTLVNHGAALNGENCAALKLCMAQRDIASASFLVQHGAGLTEFLKEARSMLEQGDLSKKDKDFIEELKESCRAMVITPIVSEQNTKSDDHSANESGQKSHERDSLNQEGKESYHSIERIGSTTINIDRKTIGDNKGIISYGDNTTNNFGPQVDEDELEMEP